MPAIKQESEITVSEWIRKILHVLVPPLLLIIAVLGSIIQGIATPTEAASVGAVGAVLLGTLLSPP